MEENKNIMDFVTADNVNAAEHEDTIKELADAKAQKEAEDKKKAEEEFNKLVEVYVDAHTQRVREHKKISRNDPCPCGKTDKNGKPIKYKNCCLKTGKYENLVKVERHK